MLKIESNKLTVCIDELGAQMSSIYLKEDGTFDIEKALQMSGKIAGICYAKTSFHDI